METTEVKRLAAALVVKLGDLHHGYPPQQLDDAVAIMIQTAVVDTYLVATGVLSVEDFESE